jgi:DNA (cytosine-5)-methyltransferase 3A
MKNVISLFDGCSVGKFAIDSLGVTDYKYYASEIDKDAMIISEYNHRDIVRIGDVTKVRYSNGILYTENGVYEIGKVDLIIGGSHCQSFSTASAYSGNNTGLDMCCVLDVIYKHIQLGECYDF